MKLKKKLILGLAHGVFDIVHIGHLEHFKEAKKKCDKLIVSVTSDKYVNKGPNRPAFSIKDRVNFLKSVKWIDDVIVSNHETAINSIRKIKPNVYFKGLDYKNLNKKSKNNLSKEINELKKFGGQFYVTNSKLKSSSKILNENFNFVNDKVKSFLKKINKKNFLENLKFSIFDSNKKKFNILLAGEQILDIYTKVNLQGKSQKSGVVTSVKVERKRFGGGTILISNLLSHFINDLSYFIDGNKNTLKLTKSFFDNFKNIKFIYSKDIVNKILIKERFINNYSKSRLFQVNQNEDFFVKKNNDNYRKKLLHHIKFFQNIILFDFGYGYIDDKFADKLKNKKNKFFINCQTNSSNYGFNLFSKYKKAEILCVDEAEFRLTFRNRSNSVDEILEQNSNFLKRYKIFIVTSGSKGCYLLNNKKISFIPTVFETTLDTTGCGDIFFSTFICFYLQKKFTLNEIAFLSHISAGLHGLQEGNKLSISKNILFQNLQSILK